MSQSSHEEIWERSTFEDMLVFLRSAKHVDFDAFMRHSLKTPEQLYESVRQREVKLVIDKLTGHLTQVVSRVKGIVQAGPYRLREIKRVYPKGTLVNDPNDLHGISGTIIRDVDSVETLIREAFEETGMRIARSQIDTEKWVTWSAIPLMLRPSTVYQGGIYTLETCQWLHVTLEKPAWEGELHREDGGAMIYKDWVPDYEEKARYQARKRNPLIQMYGNLCPR